MDNQEKQAKEKNLNDTPQPPNPYGDYEDNRPFEERFKETVTKYRLYLLRLWEARWRFVKINALVPVFTLIYLLFLINPYYESTDKV